jgi:choline dehydrogenase-like flavoprotein
MKYYDAVVIGSGAGGSAVAWSLSQRGLSVAVIEKGDWFNKADSFRFEGWESEGHRRLSPIPSVRRDKLGTRVDSSNSDVEVSFYEAVGGSTNIYSGHFPRFREEDFTRRSDLGVAEDWPIKLEELERYYELNEKRMKVGGRLGDPYFPKINTLGPEVPVGITGNKLSSAFKSLGWHCWLSYGAFDTNPESKMRCQNLGPCNLGCPTNSKMTAVNGYLEDALKKNVDLYTRTSAGKLIVNEAYVREVELVSAEGKKFFIKADLFFLSAGALGTPKILLSSEAAGGRSLANRSGQVGRNLMVHPLGLAEGAFDEEQDVDSGPEGSWLYSLEFGAGGPFGKPGYMLQALRGFDLIGMGLRKYRTGELKFGSGMVQTLGKKNIAQVGIAVVVEDLPNQSNYVALQKNNRDEFGHPGLEVVYKVDKHSIAAMAHGLNSSRKVLSEMGAISTRGVGPVRGAGWHPSGTARMGDNPEKFVTNHRGQAHEVENLFIADSSLFPSGSCLNPTNTIQALSLYVAEHAFESR